MRYREKSTQNIYKYVERDSDNRYVLERDLNISVESATVTRERIGVPLEVLESDFELLEEKDNE